MINGLMPGGGEDPTPRRLTPQEMQEWNQYLKYVEQQGYKGSKELDAKNKGLGASLFEKFKQANPGISINYDIVPSVQYEHQLLAEKARDFAKRQGNANADQLYSNNSKLDGWFGSLTSQQYFPEMKLQTKRNGQLVSSQNLGLVNGSMMPTGTDGTSGVKVPKGTEVWKGDDGGWYYTDPQSGDAIRIK